MKRLIFLVVISTLSLSALFSQADTYTFSGAISGTTTWDSYDTIYIDGDVTIGNGASLTIEPNTNGSNAGNNDNVYLIFQDTYNITISGTGVLDVSGTKDNFIFFTADNDNDHVFGESGERWENITFSSSSGTSVVDYAYLEWGTGRPVYLSGGGIYAASSDNVTIKNTIITNCDAFIGGGISIDFADISIENCLIYNNNSGAGIDIASGSPNITNTSLIGNDNTYGAGGIYITSATPSISNCILWNNTHNSSPDDYDGSSSYISYSAATESINSTGMIELSSTNTDPDGPNFTDPSSDDYSISFLSPCRDAGTTGGPSTDLEGNNRIGPADIGAYEVQYSRWAGTTSQAWTTATNWAESISPASGSSDVVIPGGLSNYPTSETTQDFTIGSGHYLILEPGGHLTLDELTNNGTLQLQSDANGIFSFIVNTYTDNGAEDIELFITGGGTPPNYKWHYFAPPVSSLSTSAFSDSTDNILAYDETDVANIGTTGSINDGWNWYDGYDGTSSFSTMSPGNGYNIYHSNDITFTFNGALNTSNASLNLTYGADENTNADSLNHGWFLAGNPFPSGLDWDAFADNLGGGAGMSGAIWFTSNGTMASYVDGVGTPAGTNGNIPAMQGFFLKTYKDTTITLTAAMREHNVTNRYKSEEALSLIRLQISNYFKTDETVIRLEEEAGFNYNPQTDALKFKAKQDNNPHIWLEYTNGDYAIKTLPFPETDYKIPITVDIPSFGRYLITTPSLENLSGYSLLLIDQERNLTFPMEEGSRYLFIADPGSYTDRFELKIIASTTSSSDIAVEAAAKSKITSYNNTLTIQPSAAGWEKEPTHLRIFDLQGRLVFQKQKLELLNGAIYEYSMNLPDGIYVVEIVNSRLREVQKVFFMK